MEGVQGLGARENRGVEWVREAGEERSGSGTMQGGMEQGEIKNNSQHFVIFCERNNTKWQELLRKGAVTWGKRYVKWKVSDYPCPSPLHYRDGFVMVF